MVTIIFRMVFIIFSFAFSQISYSNVWVKPYIKQDGTYVRGHFRSNPDGNIYNNWSTKHNVNPYTGKRGWKNSSPNNYQINPYNQRKSSFGRHRY